MAIVIVGLGNTGNEYAKTRHNAGRMAAEIIAKQEGFEDFVFKKGANAMISEGVIGGEKVIIVLPETMMNLSGKAVAALVKSPKAASKLLVLQDELDLPLGTIKMVFERGSGGHKGIESITRAIKTNAFARMRIGISGQGKKNNAKKPAGEEKVIKHVIGKFSPKEEPVLKKTLKKVAAASVLFVTEGIEKATMEANTK
jgi:PTH1 family peptidyl-tRNA hydrolase